MSTGLTSPVTAMLAHYGLARCQRCQRIVVQTRLAGQICGDPLECADARRIANGYAKKAGWRR